MDGFFQVGSVAGTHGLRGTLRVFPLTDDPKRFSILKEVMIETKSARQTYHITGVAYHKKFVLLDTAEISDINAAELLKGASLWIPEEKALPLAEDEYYARDLYGLSVLTEEGEALGKLTEIYRTGANDVYAVKKDGDTKELLIPAIKQCIREVDLKGGRMVVRLLEGLR